MGKSGGDLPGMIAGLGTLSFGGFHWFGLLSHGVSSLLPRDLLVKSEMQSLKYLFFRGCKGEEA